MISGKDEAWAAFRRNPGEEAFGRFYEETKRLVYSLCYRILRNEEDAQDAFQSTYARLIALAKDPNETEQAADIQRLATALAVRESQNHLARRSRRRLREVAMETWPDVESAEAPADQIAARRQESERLEILLAFLPDRLRVPVVLHYFQGMKQNEIAEALGLSTNAVSYRIKRALKKLQPILRRAGLGDSTAALVGIVAAAEFLDPPSSLAAAAVYAKACAAAAGGAALAGAATGAAAKLAASLAVMKTHLAAIVGIALLSAAGWMVYHANQSMPLSEIRTPAASPVAVAPTQAPQLAVSPSAAGVFDSLVPEPPMPKSALAPQTLKLAVETVWEGSNDPVAGAAVELSQYYAPRSGAPLAKSTDKQGRADFDLPVQWIDAQYKASHPEAGNKSGRIGLPSSKPLRIELRRAASVYGRVWISGESRPAAGAEVHIVGGEQSVKAAEDGSYTIANIGEESVRVAAMLGVLRSYISESEIEPLHLTPDQALGPCDLILTPGLRLTGTVRDAQTGEAIPNALVRTIDGMGETQQKATTDATGQYWLEGLEETRLRVTAAAEAHDEQLRLIRPVRDRDAQLNFELGPGGSIDATVVDEESRPIEGARIGLHREAPVRYLSMFDGQRTDAEGKVHLTVGVSLQGSPVGISLQGPPALRAAKEGYRYTEFPKVEFPAGSTHATAIVVLRRTDSEPKEPKERGAFAGRVADAAGNPLAGLSVSWQQWMGWNEGQRRTLTDANGAYRLEVPLGKSESWSLNAWGKGWAPAWKDELTPGTLHDPKQVDFVLEPAHWLAGVVVDPKGEGIEAATLRAVFDDRLCAGREIPGPERTVHTDSQGRFRLEDLPGPNAVVDLWAKGLSQVFRKPLEVDREHQIVLQPKGAIRGRVTDRETGEPIKDFVVKLGGYGYESSRGEPGESFSTTDGRFALTEMDGGQYYEVIVDAPEYSLGYEKKAKVQPESQAKEIVFRLTKEARLEGVVLNASDSTPIPGARIVSAFFNDQYFFEWSHLEKDNADALRGVRRTTTDAQGLFSLPESQTDTTLFIIPEGFERVMIKPQDRSRYEKDGQLRIALNPGASIAGMFVLGGKPQGDVRVSLNRAATNVYGHEDIGAAQTRPDGQFRWDGLAAGDYLLYIWGQGCIAVQEKITLAPGEQKWIDLGAELGPCALTGRVLDGDQPMPGVTVSLSPQFAWAYQFQNVSDGDGRFHFEGLQPGKYEASMRKEMLDSVNRKTLSVPSDQDVDLVFREGGPGYRIKGKLVFADGVPSEVQSKFFEAHLQAQPPGAGDPYGRGDVSNGHFQIQGCFQGDYALTLNCAIGETHRSTTIQIPGLLHLDTTGGDQDLGDIAVPPVGAVRFQIAFDPPTTPRPDQFVAFFLAEGDWRRKSEVNLDPNAPDQAIAPILAGEYEVTFLPFSFSSTPSSAQVTVAPGQMPTLAFTLRVYGFLMGEVTDDADPMAPVTPRRIALEGPGGKRELAPADREPNPEEAKQLLNDRTDIAYSNHFVFQNLPAGAYQLTIEADGFAPHTQTIEVVPGQTANAHLDVHMKPF